MECMHIEIATQHTVLRKILITVNKLTAGQCILSTLNFDYKNLKSQIE